MIKVLNIISDTNIGGAGRVLLNYMSRTDREHFDVSVAVPRGSLLKAPLEDLGTTVYEVPGLADRSYHKDDVKALITLIRQVDPDIVHTHGALSGRIAGRRCGKVVIYTRHSAFPVPAKLKYPPGRWVNKWVNEYYSDHIIAVSPATAENLTDAGISPKRITIMMNGVTPVARKSPEECAALRERWGIELDDFVLGILARVEPYKGHLHILEAMKLLAEQGKKVRLLVAGTGSFEAKLKASALEMGVSDRVVFLGFQGDVSAVLSVLDLQLNASYGTEACSMALLEGLSMGLPAVVSTYGGNPWLIDDGETGLLFENRNSAALAACIARLMDEPQTLDRMKARCVEVFSQRFTAEIFAQNTEKVYYNVLEGKNHE
ncbi:MAG: glycosyltransferase family 4 protein [Oscillospiraceae bacterium]|nr:glycosyltransferase family 4 protein [Oscillospiraceae bacterium]